MRGLKPLLLYADMLTKGLVARSAPLMRGLKHRAIAEGITLEEFRRAVCPANEGIETFVCANQLAWARAASRGLPR